MQLKIRLHLSLEYCAIDVICSLAFEKKEFYFTRANKIGT